MRGYVGCVFNQPSGVEESTTEQHYRDHKSILPPCWLVSTTLQSSLLIEDTLSTCTHTPRHLTNLPGLQHSFSIPVPVPEMITVCVDAMCAAAVKSGSQSLCPLWRRSEGQSSISSSVQPTKVLRLHQLKKYVDSFTLSRSKSPGRENPKYS